MSDSILSSNHRERARQIENIKRVARGDKVEKKIYVQMEDLDEKKKRQEQVRLERENKNKRSDALKEARKLVNQTDNVKMKFIYQAHQAFFIWNKILPEIDQEVINLIDPILESRKLKDDHLVALLQYLELSNEIEKA